MLKRYRVATHSADGRPLQIFTHNDLGLVVPGDEIVVEADLGAGLEGVLLEDLGEATAEDLEAYRAKRVARGPGARDRILTAAPVAPADLGMVDDIEEEE